MPAKVKLRTNKTQEQLLHRFRKQIIKSRTLSDVRRKQINGNELRQIKRKKAQQRQQIPSPRER